MDFDYTTETITPDSTSLLTIGGTGALELSSGTTAQQPVGAIAGAIRWNTTVPQLEYYNGTSWLSFQGSVSSVAVSGSNGIGVAGSPITSSGTITLSLGAITPTSVASSGAVSGTSLTASGLTANSFLYSGTGGLLTTTAAPTNGQILVGSTGAAPALATLASGTGISTTVGAGTLQINNTGVTSAIGTANQVIVSGATGAVTFSLPQSIGTASTPTFAQLTISNNPVASTDTVNLGYLQSVISGLEWKQVAQAATTGNLTATYSNGASGVGATLTNSGVQAAFAIDGYTANLNDRIVVKNQTTQTQNGIYFVSNQGSGATNWVLTRTTDSNTSASLNNATLYVTNGTANGDTGWTQTTANPTIGTSNVVFVQFSGSGTYTAGTGLTLTGNQFSLTSPVVSTLGGTGTTTAPSSGQILVGTSGGQYVPFTLASGTGISTTTGSGTLQINNTGVTSIVAGTAISVSGATGAVTVNNTGVVSFSLNDASTTSIYTTAPTAATTGAVASTITLKTQTTNLVFAAPNGSTGQPTFRSLVYADLPLKLYVENPSTPTAPTATGANAVAIGSGAAASASGSLAIGNGSSAVLFGANARANGDFATAGDAQSIKVLYRIITTTAAATEMFLDGATATQRLVLPTNSAWTFQVRIVCRRTDATGVYGSWLFSGLIWRDATAASTTINGTTKTVIGRVGGLGGANDPVVSADTTNGSLKIAVTGLTGDTIRWVADADLVQVTN